MFSITKTTPAAIAFFQQFTHLTVKSVLFVEADSGQQHYYVFKSGAMLDGYWHAIVDGQQVDITDLAEDQLYNDSIVDMHIDAAIADLNL